MAIIIRKNKNGISYYVRIRDPYGKFYPSKTFQRKVDAATYEANLKIGSVSGQRATCSLILGRTVNEYFENWISDCRGEVSKGWSISLRQMYRDHVRPIVGNIKLSSFSKQNFQVVMCKMKEKSLADSTRTHVFNLLRGMFGDLKSYYGVSRDNPIDVSLKPKIVRKKAVHLSIEEIKKLLKESENQWFGIAIWIGIFTGLRISEIQALKWCHINFESGNILVKDAFKRKEQVVQNYPKSRTQYSVAMTPDLKSFLKRKFNNQSKDEYVAKGFSGEMLDHGTFYKALKRTCESIGIKIISPHGLRHSCSYLMQSIAGASTEDIKNLLGHSSTKSTQTYIHTTDERLSRVISGLQLGIYE